MQAILPSGRPPFFLQNCDKVPSTTTDGNRIHRERRAFKLSVSLDTLLGINDAAELLFQFLSDKHYDNFVWLSDVIFITRRAYLGLDAIYSFDIDDVGGYVICKLSSVPARLDNHIGFITDTILLLLARHKTVKYIELRAGIYLTSNDEPFPTSLEVLQAFVSDAQSARRLFVGEYILSVDQWRVIFFNCNHHVMPILNLRSFSERAVVTLVEAMKLHQCPAQLELKALDTLTAEMFRDFLAALESTTSLQELDVTFFSSNECFVALCQAVSHNCQLHRVVLDNLNPFALSDSEWELICRSIASHPTLKQLDFYTSTVDSSRSPERDQLMIQHISRNTVLWELNCDEERCFFHNSQHVLQAVRPFLEWNRFRTTVVQAIKQETDRALRQKLIACSILIMSTRVRQSPALTFLLCRENSDLLAELSLPKNLLFPLGLRASARPKQEVVGERMRNSSGQ